MSTVQPSRPNEQPSGGGLPPEAPVEIELKLRVAPGDLDRLRGADVLTRIAAGPGTTRSLTSFYYDTPDCALQRRGITLRVRRIGQRFVQSLKTERRGDGLARGEWEVALPAMVPAPDAFDDPEAKALLDGVPVEALTHLFTSRIQRETRILSLPDAVVECAFDTGTIETRDASDPVAEVELELKEGRAAALYRLALSFLDEVPLRVSEVTKAERGYRLVARRPPGVMYDPKTPVTSRMTVDEAIAARAGPLPAALDRQRGGGRGWRRPRRRAPDAGGAAPAALGPDPVQEDRALADAGLAARRIEMAGRRAGPGARLGRLPRRHDRAAGHDAAGRPRHRRPARRGAAPARGRATPRCARPWPIRAAPGCT